MISEEKEKKEDEDYSILYKILMIFIWWKEIQYGDWDLKAKGYKVKYRSRLICIGIGIIIYTLIILMAIFIH